MPLAIIGSSVYEDLFILLVAIVLFGHKFPEVATTLGRRIYQFRRGLDDLRSEITRPIRDKIETPLREAAEEARREANPSLERPPAASEPPVPAAPEAPPPETLPVTRRDS